MIIFKNFVIIFIENKGKNIRNLKNERNLEMDTIIKIFSQYSPGILDIILITNVILKYFDLIDWNWKIALWPLWTEIIIIILVIIMKE